jgi:hypothetical protein
MVKPIRFSFRSESIKYMKLMLESVITLFHSNSMISIAEISHVVHYTIDKVSFTSN